MISGNLEGKSQVLGGKSQVLGGGGDRVHYLHETLSMMVSTRSNKTTSDKRLSQCSQSGTEVVHCSFQGKIPLMWLEELEECVKTTNAHKYDLVLKNTPLYNFFMARTLLF